MEMSKSSELLDMAFCRFGFRLRSTQGHHRCGITEGRGLPAMDVATLGEVRRTNAIPWSAGFSAY